MSDKLKKITKLVAQKDKEFKTLAKNIHANPELGYQERQAVAFQSELLETLGFKVTTPFSNLETAFRAVAGEGDPCFAFISEYDALPELGHACGHNLIATASIAAAWATKELLESEGLKGTVMVIGTPAEEGLGGKLQMIRDRVFMRVDAAMMAHPADILSPDIGSIGVVRYDVTFRGESAHASASPALGRNALDAANLLFAGINAWRQYLPEAARVHGVILDGGTVPNVIPDHARCRFYLRGQNDHVMHDMEKRFKDIVKGAAMMSGTKYRIHEEENGYRPILVNEPMNQAYYDAAEEAGMSPTWEKGTGRASTDFGNLSQVVPGAHVYFKVAGSDVAWHSPEFAKVSGSDSALDQTLKAAALMTSVAYRFFSDEAFRKSVKTAFQKSDKKK